MRSSSSRRHSWVAGAAVVVAALAVLAACSAKGADGEGGAGAAVAPSASSGAVPGPPQAGSKSPGASRPAVRTAAVVRTGQIALTDRHLAQVRSEVDHLLSTVGGSVDNEETTNDRHGRVQRSTLVLRVPVDRFETTKDALERLGRLTSSSESSKDVTTDVIDTTERVQTLQNSLDRLQKFQRAATDVGDLIRYEDQISSRQAELQSLKAQQTYLSDQTSMSTITLSMSTPETYVAPPGALRDAGFVTGLRSGWHALVGLVVVVLTVVGALLPFLVVLAVLGVPGWVALRSLLRRRARRPAPTTD